MKFAVKVVMVDLDGTLIHTAPEIAVAANEMLKALDFAPLHLELVESFIGEGAPMLVKRCLTTTIGAESDADLFERAERLFLSITRIMRTKASLIRAYKMAYKPYLMRVTGWHV